MSKYYRAIPGAHLDRWRLHSNGLDIDVHDAPDWTDAICAKERAWGLFFGPEQTGPSGEYLEWRAKKMCAKCPVIKECRQYAIDTKDKWAIMGGTTPEERGMLTPAAIKTRARARKKAT